MLSAYSIKILHVNIWLTACVVLDFITVPILQGALKDVVDELVSDCNKVVIEDAVDEEILNFDNNPSCEQFVTLFKTFIPKFGRNSQTAWNVVNTLLDVLVPLEKGSDWIMADVTFKKQVRLHFGSLSCTYFTNFNEIC